MYLLEIGTDGHAPYRVAGAEFITYTDAAERAKALHDPDWRRDRCVIVCNAETGRACGFTEYLNGKVTIRPA